MNKQNLHLKVKPLPPKLRPCPVPVPNAGAGLLDPAKPVVAAAFEPAPQPNAGALEAENPAEALETAPKVGALAKELLPLLDDAKGLLKGTAAVGFILIGVLKGVAVELS